MYADYEFYTSEYLLGKAPTVPEESFPYWEREARMQIDSYTFGRIEVFTGAARRGQTVYLCSGRGIVSGR